MSLPSGWRGPETHGLEQIAEGCVQGAMDNPGDEVNPFYDHLNAFVTYDEDAECWTIHSESPWAPGKRQEYEHRSQERAAEVLKTEWMQQIRHALANEEGQEIMRQIHIYKDMY